MLSNNILLSYYYRIHLDIVDDRNYFQFFSYIWSFSEKNTAIYQHWLVNIPAQWHVVMYIVSLITDWKQQSIQVWYRFRILCFTRHFLAIKFVKLNRFLFIWQKHIKSYRINIVLFYIIIYTHVNIIDIDE